MKISVGIYYKGVFCPIWGGVYLTASERFQRGGLADLSRCLDANSHDAGVVVWYKD